MADLPKIAPAWPRHAIKISVLLLWLGLLAWQRLESRDWPAPDPLQAAFIPDHYDLYALNYQGRKIGWAVKSLNRLPGGGYQAAQGLRVQTEFLGRTLEIKLDVSANLDPGLNLLNFNYALSCPPATAVEQGRREADGRLSIRINAGEYGPLIEKLAEDSRLGAYADLLDFRREIKLPPPAGPGLASFLGPYFCHLGLVKGANYSVTVLDPIARRLTPLKARVEAEVRQYDPEIAAETAAFLVRTGPPEAEARLWLDRFGRTLKEEALGFTLLLVYDQEAALENITPFKPPAALQALAGPLKELLDKR